MTDVINQEIFVVRGMRRCYDKALVAEEMEKFLKSEKMGSLNMIYALYMCVMCVRTACTVCTLCTVCTVPCDT